jgi:hypothetical protein
VLPNGKELIAGGYIRNEIPVITDHSLSTAQIYDSSTGKWTETGEMHAARWGHTAVLLRNGKVLVAGGEDAKKNPSSSAELYDPATGKWTLTTSMHSAHYGCKSRLNPDGTVLVFVAPANSPIEKCEQYDSATETWTVITNK